MTKNRVRLILLTVPMMWGLVFVAVRRVLDDIDTFQLTTIRFSIICVAFGFMMLVRRDLRPRYDRRQWRMLWLIGFLGVPMSQLPVVYAQNFLHPALASLIITTSPAMAAILAPLFLPERVTVRQAIGFAVAFVGVAVIIIVGAGDASFDLDDILGAAIGLVTALGWTLYTIALKRIAGADPLATVGIGLMLGTVFLLPWVPSTIGVLGDISVGGWWSLVYLGLIGSFLGYVMWFWSLKYLDAAETSAYLYLVPVFALGWSLLILGTGPPLLALGGGVLVLGGVALTQLDQKAPVTPLEP